MFWLVNCISGTISLRHLCYRPGKLAPPSLPTWQPSTPWPCLFELLYSTLQISPSMRIIIRFQQAGVWIKCATQFYFNGAEAFAGFQDAPLVAPLAYKPAIQRKNSAQRALSAKTNHLNSQVVPKSRHPNPFRRLVCHSGPADPPGDEQESTLSAVWWDVQPVISQHYGSCRLTTLRWVWVA